MSCCDSIWRNSCSLTRVAATRVATTCRAASGGQSVLQVDKVPLL
jgi:hypothetical protein